MTLGSPLLPTAAPASALCMALARGGYAANERVMCKVMFVAVQVSSAVCRPGQHDDSVRARLEVLEVTLCSRLAAAVCQ